MSLFKIDPPIIAHRGASAYAPENTLAAFLKAKALGINWVEFDVMLAACGELVVIHDETLERTTNGVGEVILQPYSSLRMLDAGSWFSPDFSSEGIPTFANVLTLLNANQLAANVEIKALPGQEDKTVKAILNTIEKHWKGGADKLLISSFSRSVLFAVRKYSMNSYLGFLMHEWEPDWREIYAKLRSISMNVNQELLTRERVAELKSSGCLLLAYTVNDKARAIELFSWGVDAVFSDSLLSIS